MSLRKYMNIVNEGLSPSKPTKVNEWNPFKKKTSAPVAAQEPVEVSEREWTKIKALEFFIYQHTAGGSVDTHGDVPFHVETLKKLAQKYAGTEAGDQIRAFLKRQSL